MYVKLNTTVSCLGPFKLYRWLHFQTSKIEKKMYNNTTNTNTTTNNTNNDNHI